MHRSEVQDFSKSSEKKEKRLLFLLIKRSFDILFSTTLILLLLPLYCFVALLIKWDSAGPILHTHKRVGKNHKEITIFKFRTMYIDADKRLTHLLDKDPKLKKEWEVYHKLKRDPRCTFIGKILRRFSLDELPQFFNVLEGSLSVVGPRPYFRFELEKKEASSLIVNKILSVKPGITGLWQTSGRSHLSYTKRLNLDASYVDRQSFSYDLYLILKTIPSVLLSKGAF